MIRRIATLLPLLSCAWTCAAQDDTGPRPETASNAPLSLTATTADDASAVDPPAVPDPSAESAPPLQQTGEQTDDGLEPSKTPSTVSALNQTLNSSAAAVADSGSDESSIGAADWYRGGLFSLGIVLALISIIALVFRRLVPSLRTASTTAVEVLGRSPIGPKQNVTLVRMGRRVLLLGVASEQVNMLCEVNDPMEVAELVNASSSRPTLRGEQSFGHVLEGQADGFEDAEPEVGGPRGGRSATLALAKGNVQGLLAKLDALQARESA